MSVIDPKLTFQVNQIIKMLLNWNQFKKENPDSETAFEKLSKRFFAAECNYDSSRIMDPTGYPGIECRPIKINQKFVSYQAKFSNNESVSWGKLNESINVAGKKIKEGKYELDVIYIFVNGKIPQSLQQQENLNNLANEYGIKLHWYFGKNIIERLETSEDPEFVILKRFFSPALHSQN